MNSSLRMMSDRQTMVLTLPSLKFDSLQDQNLARLETLFRRVVQRVTGTTLILDVTVVQSAGAAFLTKVNQFADSLRQNQIKFVIVGGLRGLFELVGWQRRFRLYPSLLDALMAWKEWSTPADADKSSKWEPSPDQLRRDLPPCECLSCRNGKPYLPERFVERSSP